MSELGCRIEQLLSTCIGPQNAISAPEIARRLNASERTVRKVISEDYSSWPMMVSSKPGLGFYVVQDIETLADRRRTLIALKRKAKKKLEEFDQFLKRHGFGSLTKDAS